MYKFSTLETAHRCYTAVKAACVVWVGLHLCDILNGSTTAFQEKKKKRKKVSVRTCSQVNAAFYEFAQSAVESRIDFLFI